MFSAQHYRALVQMSKCAHLSLIVQRSILAYNELVNQSMLGMLPLQARSRAILPTAMATLT